MDAALQEWMSICERNDCLDERAARSVAARRAKLDRQMDAGNHIAVQKSAPGLEQWLHDDLAARLGAVADLHAQERSRERRTAESAQTLLAELRAADGAVDASLMSRLEAVAGTATTTAPSKKPSVCSPPAPPRAVQHRPMLSNDCVGRPHRSPTGISG